MRLPWLPFSISQSSLLPIPFLLVYAGGWAAGGGCGICHGTRGAGPALPRLCVWSQLARMDAHHAGKPESTCIRSLCAPQACNRNTACCVPLILPALRLTNLLLPALLLHPTCLQACNHNTVHAAAQCAGCSNRQINLPGPAYFPSRPATTTPCTACRCTMCLGTIPWSTSSSTRVGLIC